MKELVRCACATLVVVCYYGCKHVDKLSASSMECWRVKDGEFTDIMNGRAVFLTRTLTEQHESSAPNGQTALRVRWLNDCTYQLARQDRSTGEGWEPDTLTIRITSVSDTGFTYTASAVVFDTLRTLPGYQLFGLVKR